ncbi:MAG: PAS domain-containing protein [Oscillospiraceae bacterium]|nr:PAS domain-containing protein [Oscillospiraceae bacterium]
MKKTSKMICSFIFAALLPCIFSGCSEVGVERAGANPLLTGAVVLFLVVIIMLVIFRVINAREKNVIAKQAAMLDAIYNSIPAVLFTKDLNDVYTSCNSKFLETLQADRTDVIGRSYYKTEMRAEGMIDSFISDNEKVMKGNETIIKEEWLEHPDKTKRAYCIIKTPLIQDGKTAGLLCITLDVTERKKAEEAAVRSNERVEAILKNLPGMVFQHLHNRPDYTYTFVSDGCKELTGYSKEELIGQSAIKMLSMMHPDDSDHIEKLIDKTLLKGLPFETAYRITTRDGEEKWIWERSRVIEKNPDGTPRLIEGYHADITERRKLEEAEIKQRLMESRMETIMGNLPGMVFQTCNNFPEYTIRYVSEGSKGLVGYAPEELIGGKNKFMAMVHPDDLDEIERRADEAAAKGVPYEQNYRLVLPDGSIKWIWERGVVVEGVDGEPDLTEGYMCDVTDRKQLEIAEFASRAKSEFLAVMSHEIRTPMNSIMGFAELAMDSAISPQVKDYLKKITDSTKWLLRIVNDILDISKIESGKMELENIPFDLHSVFSRCQSVILPASKDKGLELKIYAEALKDKKLLGDPVRLYQVLVNLLSNAVKFTDSGTISFSSTVKRQDESTALVYFEVKDSGIGMSSEQVSKIFDPFTQADSSTTRNYGGTGLGLAIVKNIVELMDGAFKVDSAPGEGSTFSFEILFGTIDAQDSAVEDAIFDTLEKPNFEGITLICDDNQMNREVICEHLARVGLDAVTAENGKIGVDIVRERMESGEEPFDLIFMDMFMPVMDGLEAAVKIAELNSGSPIVAMTANVMVSELEKYKKHGMLDCLGKPFTSRELWRVLLKYLTPVSSDPIYEYIGDGELLKKLKINFVKNNQTVHTEITEAIAAGDIKRAHRLAHTLKGSAGMIGKTELKNAAEEVEILLRNEKDSVLKDKLNQLEAELNTAIEELKPLLEESAEQVLTLDGEQALALLEKLEPMLANLNPGCAGFLDEIRAIPKSEELAGHIENYNFKLAASALKELKKQLIIDNC